MFTKGKLGPLPAAALGLIFLTACGVSGNDDPLQDTTVAGAPNPYVTSEFNIQEGNSQADGCVYARLAFVAADKYFVQNDPSDLVIGGQAMADIKAKCLDMYEGPLLAAEDLSMAKVEDARVNILNEVKGYSMDFYYGN